MKRRCNYLWCGGWYGGTTIHTSATYSKRVGDRISKGHSSLITNLRLKQLITILLYRGNTKIFRLTSCKTKANAILASMCRNCIENWLSSYKCVFALAFTIYNKWALRHSTARNNIIVDAIAHRTSFHSCHVNREAREIYTRVRHTYTKYPYPLSAYKLIYR